MFGAILVDGKIIESKERVNDEFVWLISKKFLFGGEQTKASFPSLSMMCEEGCFSIIYEYWKSAGGPKKKR